MQEYTNTSKALSDRSRLRILKLLEEHELCVCQLREVLSLKQSTVSKHLSILKRERLVESRREGTWAFYSLPKRRGGDFRQVQTSLALNWLNDDPLVRSDRAALKKILNIDIKMLCRT